MTDNTQEREAGEWRVSQSGNPNKAWLVCGGKKISALMSLQAARDLAFIHNSTVDFQVLKACKEERQAALAALPTPSIGEYEVVRVMAEATRHHFDASSRACGEPEMVALDSYRALLAAGVIGGK